MKIAYSLAGEGRGHTTRAIGLGASLIDAGHDVRFFTDGEALQLITEKFGEKKVSPMKVPRFNYGPKGVRLIRSAIDNIGLVFNRKPNVNSVIKEFGEWMPDAVICDFEPTMYSVAKKLNIPFICFDSQRFANACKVRGLLPFFQRLKLIPISFVVRLYAPKTELCIISKPFDLKIKRRFKNVHLIGGVMRPEILNSTWRPKGTHILCYLRGRTENVLPILTTFSELSGLEVRLYGKTTPKNNTKIISKPISEKSFVSDMVSSDLVISTAGTQVISETHHLGVPTILLPEPGQIEQKLNSILAQKLMSRTIKVLPKNLTVDVISKSIENLHKNNHKIPEYKPNEALDLIHQFLKSEN